MSKKIRQGDKSQDLSTQSTEEAPQRSPKLGADLSFRNLGDNCYEVRFGSLVLGEVYRDESAWYYAQWMIAGDRKHVAAGGVNGATTKRNGYVSRASAARVLAVTRSSTIVSYMDTQHSSEQKG